MPLAHAACWLVLYIAMGALSARFNVNTAANAPYVWLPSGVSLAALLLSGSRSRLPLVIAFALAQSVMSHVGGRDISSSLVLGALAGIAPLIAASVVRWMRLPLEGLQLLQAVVVAALVSALLLGGGGAFYFAMTKDMPLLMPLLAWSAAIFVGVCITLPPLAVWALFRPARSARSNLCRDMVGVASFLVMAALTWWLFDDRTTAWFDQVGVTCPLYLPMFCVVIVTIIGGARGGTLAVLALTLICLDHTAHGEGPFASQTASVSLTLLQAQLYIGVSAMLVLIVHALRGAETQVYAQADRWRTDLELALAGASLVAYTVDPATGAVQWRGDVRRLTGYGAEQLSSVDKVLARLHPLDRDHLRTRWRTSHVDAQPTSSRFAFRLSSPTRTDAFIDLVDAGSSLSDGNARVAFVAGVWQHSPLAAE
jgi:integral membrane sensor domain MASE1